MAGVEDEVVLSLRIVDMVGEVESLKFYGIHAEGTVLGPIWGRTA